jgi:hypothetical protein
MKNAFKACLISVILILSIISCTTLRSPKPETPAAQETPLPPAPTVDYTAYEALTISKGEFTDKIVITWKGTEGGVYALYRSSKNDEPYTKLADITTGETAYTDTAEPGLKVWYRLETVTGSPVQIPTDTGALMQTGQITDPEKNDYIHDNFGYIKSKKPKGKTLEQVTRTFTKGKPKFSKDEQAQVDKHIELIKSRIMHPVKLNMVLTLAQPYFTSGKLAAFSDFDSFSFDMPNREVFLFSKDKTYVIIFKSTVICRFIRENNDGVFLERLLYNGVAFSTDIGEREVVDEKGYSRILPAFDTVGFASAYYEKYADWKNSTAMFATSRDSLQKELQKAQRSRDE